MLLVIYRYLKLVTGAYTTHTVYPGNRYLLLFSENIVTNSIFGKDVEDLGENSPLIDKVLISWSSH